MYANPLNADITIHLLDKPRILWSQHQGSQNCGAHMTQVGNFLGQEWVLTQRRFRYGHMTQVGTYVICQVPPILSHD